MLTGLRVLLVLALVSVSAAARAESLWEGRSVAFFGVTLLDTSIEGEIHGTRPDEIARVEIVNDYIRERLEEEGLVLVDLAPVAEELARVRNPADCNNCDIRMARELGADYSVVGEVQKVSNLILSMNLYIRDVESGHHLRGQAVDIRSNTDETWIRGMRYILNRSIFTGE